MPALAVPGGRPTVSRREQRRLVVLPERARAICRRPARTRATPCRTARGAPSRRPARRACRRRSDRRGIDETQRRRRTAACPPGQSVRPPLTRSSGSSALLAGRLPFDRAEVAGVQPSFAGDRALFVGREPFDLPGRQEQVRKRERRPPEDAADDRAQPRDRSRWTMCVNSWVKTRRSQSSVLPMNSEPDGACRGRSTIVS